MGETKGVSVSVVALRQADNPLQNIATANKYIRYLRLKMTSVETKRFLGSHPAKKGVFQK